MCFQRDSRKDQIIVWCFILGTAGLLGWAAVKRVLEAKGGGMAVTLPGLGTFGGAGSRATGRRSEGVVGREPGSGGLQQRRGGGGVGGLAGGSSRDEAARGAYSPIGLADDAVRRGSG
jgi:hypothetical protein